MEKNFETIFKEFLKPVYNFIWRFTGDKNAASDMTQETFLKIWKNLDKFDKQKNLKTWIFTIARNTTIDWMRKKREILSLDAEIKNEDGKEETFAENLPDLEALPDEIFSRKELKAELEEALFKIRPDFREIIFLHYKENMTFEEISKISGKPLNTVKSHHLRALLSLRKMLITNSPNPS